jgi:hypothetical protein
MIDEIFEETKEEEQEEEGFKIDYISSPFCSNNCLAYSLRD